MATGGETYKKKQFSFKQRVNHRKFRIQGAVGFANGSLASARNRLEALAKELPKKSGYRDDIKDLIYLLRGISNSISRIGDVAISSAGYAEQEASDGTTNSGSA